jgi:hypothetical protein
MVVVSSQQNASVCFVQSLLAAVRPEKGPRNGLGYANQNGEITSKTGDTIYQYSQLFDQSAIAWEYHATI